jgi:hypothetical protein
LGIPSLAVFKITSVTNLRELRLST